jgi:hypothetical protein
MTLRIGATTVVLVSTFAQLGFAQQAQGTNDSSASYQYGTTTNVAAQPAQGQMQQPMAEPGAYPPGPPAAAPPPAPPPETAPPPPEAAPAESDHHAMVGRLAVGYLGFVSIPFGALSGIDVNEPGANQIASAPVVGIRYWMNPSVGIDAGLGITTTFGTQKVEGLGVSTSTNATAPTGLAVHFGLPLALKAVKHYAFQIIPEVNIGYAQQAIPNQAATLGTDHSGFHLDIGARAGAEVHFGFIGIPELSLVGSVGLRVDINQTKTEDKASNITVKDSRTVIRTTVGNEPWDMFVGNISAFYYL